MLNSIEGDSKEEVHLLHYCGEQLETFIRKLCGRRLEHSGKTALSAAKGLARMLSRVRLL